MIKIENLFNSYQETGICEIYMLHIKAFWDDRFAITSFDGGNFRIIAETDKKTLVNSKITEEQAFEVINKLNLIGLKIGHNAQFYRKKKHWQKRLTKYETKLKDFQCEVDALETIINTIKKQAHLLQ